MNSLDRSLEDGPSIVTKSFRAISTGSVGSKVVSVSVVLVSVVSGDCEDHSNRSMSKGLFCNLQAVCRLMKSGSDI